MKRMMLTSVAVAALAFCGAAANAQSGPDRQDRAPSATEQQSAPAPAEPRRGAAQSRDGKAGSADRAGSRRTTGQGAEERQPTAAGAEGDAQRPSRAEQGQNRDQARDRQGGQEGRNAQQQGRDEQRNRRSDDVRRDRQDRERSARDRDGDRERSAREGNRDRDMNRDGDRRQRESSERSRDRNDRADRDGERSRRGELSMSQEQRTRVSARFEQRIDRMNIRPLSRSNISVSIGVGVPSSVRLYDVPSDIVAIYPRFRGYRFVVVEDEIVIVEPRSRKIVTVIPHRGGVARASSRSTTGVAASNDRIRLAPEVRSEIRTVILREAECRFEPRLDFSLIIPLPRTVKVCEFPQDIVADVPEIRSYRYVVKGDDVLIVDPDEYRVVDVIR